MFEIYVVGKVSTGKMRLTKRAPDVWDSAAFSSIFLASGFSCSQTLSTPAHTQVTQTVSPQPAIRVAGQKIAQIKF
jgi:hypothetical protein